MPITSLGFFVFLILVLALYYILPRRAQNVFLLAASVVFYATWSLKFPLILLCLTLINFGMAHRLRSGNRSLKSVLWLGIGVNLLALLFFKYSNFFLPEVLGILHYPEWEALRITLKILLPIGLSYRVLENISYLVDVYRGQLPASKNVIDFTLYSMYFPKLLSGPIERARSFLPKLLKQRIVTNETLTRGITLIILGAVRKLVIADSLANLIPEKLFITPMKFSALELITGLVAYATMIYHNFAGYTDIVRGISGLFGIELSRNFFAPLFSRNFSEVWTRWHITLCQWLRDYIYLPLSRIFLRRNPSRFNVLNLIIPPLAAMVASGFWHGISWHMLVWGVLMGVFLIIGRIPMLWRPVVAPDKQPGWRQTLNMCVVMSTMILGLALFLMDLPTAGQFYRGLLNWSGSRII